MRRYITARTAYGEYSGSVLLLFRIPLSQTDAGIVQHLTTSVSRTSTRPAANAMQRQATTCRPRTRGRHPDIGRVTRRAVHRRPASRRGPSRAGLQVVPETHSRPSWDPIQYVLLFSYDTDGFHLDAPKDGKAKSVTVVEYYCWRLMQRHGRA